MDGETRFEIGRQLRYAKDVLLAPSHGLFGKWIDAEFRMSWATADRLMRWYDVLSREEFRTLRNLADQVQVTAMNALIGARTPDYVRYELVDDLNSGAVAVNPVLGEEIIRRVQAARNGQPTIAALPPPNDDLQMRRMRYAIACVKLLRQYLPREQFMRFRGWYGRAGREAFNRVLHADTPNFFGRGLVFDEPFDRDTGLPLTDHQLQSHLLEVLSTPNEDD
jgi:hypothetical protein